MLKILLKQIIYLMMFSLAISATPSWASANSPFDEAQALVKNTTDEMLSALRAEKGNIKSNPRRVYQLVDQIVLPHFDFERMSMFVLGKNWKMASADQQKRFTKEFRDLLVRTYATALVESAVENVKVEYLPIRANPGDNRITLKAKVHYSGKVLSVDYGMYEKGGIWKVWNISTEGVSLVENYRTEFNNDISKEGIDALIEKIAVRNQSDRKGQ
jgi:phospholipid transport system substrate-binding protein